MKTTTYVSKVEAYTNEHGRVTQVRVELATGHRYNVWPSEAPKAGDWVDISVEPCSPPLQPGVTHIEVAR